MSPIQLWGQMRIRGRLYHLIQIALDIVSCFMMEVTAIQIQILDSGLLEAINKRIEY